MTAAAFEAAREARGFTLASLFRRSARIFAERTAVVDDDGRHTYGAVEERAQSLAAALEQRGIGRGDRIAVLSETRREYLELYIAAAYAGITVVALNIRLHPDEIAWCLRTTRPRLVFVSSSLAPALAPARAGASPIQVVELDGPAEQGGHDASYATLVSGGMTFEPSALVSETDIHNVLFTSGTTGRAKGAMISQGAAAVRALRLAQWFRLTPADGFIGWLPMFHCAGDESFYATWLTGGVFGAFPKVDYPKMFERIESDRLSWTLLLPGVITDFVNHPRRGDFDLTSLRFVIGYGNMMPQVVREVTRALQVSFFDAFGQTEASYLIAHDEVPIGVAPSLRKEPSPLMDVRIVDDAMNEAPVGVPGECVVRGPSVMSGYLDDPEATAEVFRGGWLHTGDVLVRNEDGTLTFTDRKKYLIKTGGENVYPAEVESVLAQHPSVQEVCVVGIPDPHWGETIVAVVVLRGGTEMTADEAIQQCRGALANFKRPRVVHFVEASALPRSTTGKILRHELAARYAIKPDG